MKTKREVLEQFVEKAHCGDIICRECSYAKICGVGFSLTIKSRLQKIGAMAILRMFRKKEKPLLSAGTKIKFSDGSIATLAKMGTGVNTIYQLDFGYCCEYTDYLIGRTWEVIE